MLTRVRITVWCVNSHAERDGEWDAEGEDDRDGSRRDRNRWIVGRVCFGG